MWANFPPVNGGAVVVVVTGGVVVVVVVAGGVVVVVVVVASVGNGAVNGSLGSSVDVLAGVSATTVPRSLADIDEYSLPEDDADPEPPDAPTTSLAGVTTVAPATTIAVTVMNLVARDRIGTTDHPLVAAKVLFRQRKRLFGVLLLFMYMKVRTRLFGVPRPSVCP